MGDHQQEPIAQASVIRGVSLYQYVIPGFIGIKSR